VNRLTLQTLATTRIEDAELLMQHGRWGAGYYLLGYAVEYGLKSCLLKYLHEGDALFRDVKYRDNLKDCWTHDLSKLVSLAGLDAEFGLAQAGNANLKRFWSIVKQWKETSRYEAKSELETQDLHEAITHPHDGVFPWIRSKW
jgi:hypothetical protein